MSSKILVNILDGSAFDQRSVNMTPILRRAFHPFFNIPSLSYPMHFRWHIVQDNVVRFWDIFRPSFAWIFLIFIHIKALNFTNSR